MSAGTAPVWMLRINPTERRRLAEPELADLLHYLLELDQAAPALAAEASDDLYRLVPQLADERWRGRLLALRRSIHNDRHVPEALDLPVELPPSVARWAEHHDRRWACQIEIRRRYDDALATERSALRERLGEGNFLTTLAQSAPGVFEDACRYRRREAVDSKDRKAERALVQYLTRAMVRTSPYGRFTAVGLAQPGAGGVGLHEADPDTATPHVEVDRALFEYVMGGLCPQAADPELSLPPSARVTDGKITFFQVGPTARRRLSAPLTGATKVLVDLLGLGPRRLSRLADAVAERLAIDAAAAEQLLHRALNLGLLVTAWRGDQFVAEPVGQAQHDLEPSGAGGLLEGLRLFRGNLDRLGDTGEPDARAIHTRRQQLIAQGEDLSRRAGRPARLTVNEDYVLDPLLVEPGIHRPALDDLAAVTELLGAFDRMHVVRALVAGAVVERFGPGCRVPLAEHAESLVQMVYRAEATFVARPDARLGPPDGSLAMLAKIRHEALAALGHDLATGRSDEVSWSPGDIANLVAALPDRFRLDAASYGLVVQPDGCDLIVNDAYAGHGPMVSRFLYADQLRGGDARARLRSRLHALYGPGVRLLEDRGCYGMSLNAHPPVLDEVLDTEGWSRLQLCHDAATDTVGLVDADGAAVKALALGAELPELFPYPVRLATWLSSSGRVVLDIARVVPDRRGPTVASPRLRVGGVVLSRRRWYPGSDFPAHEAAGSDIDYLLALTRWRAAHNVPAEVMLKSLFEGPTAWDSLTMEGSRERFFELRRQSKPQYIDLASALMTRVLPRLLERRPSGCIEEARPALAEGGHAIEWMIEMARPAGGSHFAWSAR